VIEPERPRALHLTVLTGAKLVSNAALRWVGPFLPTLERAFGASTGTLTSILGAAELGGLSTTATGRYLDRGHHRRAFLAGLGAVAGSAAVATIGTTASFALSFVVLVVGVSNLTVAGHAWISSRVPYARRARSIGIFETSWALALLVGAPLIAVLINVFGWRGPFVAIGAAAVVAWLVVLRVIPADRSVAVPVAVSAGVAATPVGTDRSSLPRHAWRPLVASALSAAAGMSVFVVSGVWLEDQYGVSTAGLGLVATGFGAMELVASVASAAFADRAGKRRSVLAGLALLGVGLGVTASAGPSLVVAVLGLTLFLAGFEYAFVTSISLISEAAPLARGRALGLGNAIGTLARAMALLTTGRVYEAVGIDGSLGLAAACAAVAAMLVVMTHQ
jgi:MFS transporter, DHA1 family, inner membrane transport protein